MPPARGALLEHLGELREQLNDPGGAGEAYADAADAQKNVKLWEAAERCFVTARALGPRGQAAAQRAHMAGDAKQQAQHFARAAELFGPHGDEARRTRRTSSARPTSIPTSEEYAQAARRSVHVGRRSGPTSSSSSSERGDRLADKPQRVVACAGRPPRSTRGSSPTRKPRARPGSRSSRTATTGRPSSASSTTPSSARTTPRPPRSCAASATRRSIAPRRRASRCARPSCWPRAWATSTTPSPATSGSSSSSIAQCRPALQAIADLQEARDNPAAAADALERELKLVADTTERGQIAGRLARLYEQLDDAKNAIRALEMVRKADLEDFDALTRLCDLCEKTEQWDRVAELLAQRIEVEADEAEVSVLTRKLAGILADKLDRGDEALATLDRARRRRRPSVRAAYVELGDRLGWRGIVATKLVEWWFEAKQSAERTTQLRGAFERFSEVGREQDAVRVGLRDRPQQGRRPRARPTPRAAGDQDQRPRRALHRPRLLAKEVTGVDRARELVRQAEARVKAGAPTARGPAARRGRAHSVPPGRGRRAARERSAAIAEKPADIVDLYERQISRCKAPADRVRALARAAQVAAAKGQVERARGLLRARAERHADRRHARRRSRTAARDGDTQTGGERLRRALAASLAAGGQGARDGGKTRGSLLRRAALHGVHRDLRRLEQAFTLARRRAHRARRPADPRRARGAGARGRRAAARRGHALARPGRGVRRAARASAPRAAARSCGASSSTTRRVPRPT